MWKSWFRRGIGNLLNELPDRVKVALRNSPGGSTVHARLGQAVGLYRKLKTRIPEPVCEEILEVIVNSADESAAVRLSQLYVEAVEFCEENFGSAAITTFAQLQGRVEKRGRQAPALMEGDSPRAISIYVSNTIGLMLKEARFHYCLLFRPGTKPALTDMYRFR